MSLRSRARALQKTTGLSYQQALARVRALGERPAKLRRQTGWPLEACDRFLVDGHAPIEVVEAPAQDAQVEITVGDVSEAVQAVCEALRSTAAARTVTLLDTRGLLLAHVGGLVDAEIFQEAWMVVPQRTRAGLWREARATLLVGFTRDETSLGLVRLRMKKAVEELERLFDAEDVPPLPPASGGGPSGAPAELRVALPSRKPGRGN